MTDEFETALSRRALRRNFLLGVVNGAAFRLSVALVDAAVVLPWFVSQITASRLVIALLLPIQNGGWFLPQLFLSRYVQSRRRQLPLYNGASVVRWLFWLLLAGAPFVLGAQRPGALLAVVLLCYTGYALFGGASGLVFTGLVAEGVHPRQRGLFFAWRNLTGGLLAVVGSVFVSWVMGGGCGLAFPADFGLLALVTLGVITVMLLSFSFWEEAEAEPAAPAQGSLSRAAIGILRRDGNLRGYLLTRILLIGSGVTTSFFVLRAAELGGPQRLAGLFLLVYTVSELVSNLVWGWVNDHAGGKVAMVLLAVLALGQNLLAFFFAPGWPAALYLVIFACMGVMQSGWTVIGSTTLLEMADPGERPLYIGLSNTILGLATMLLPLGGVLADARGLLPLFAGAAGLSAAGLLALATWRDPRAARRRADKLLDLPLS